MRHVERPAAGDPVGALIVFHGYGGGPEEVAALADAVDPARRFHVYLPQAPHRGRDGGASWFVRAGGPPVERQLVPVAAWLDALPHPAERTVLGGWSQGANLAYALGLAAGRPRPAGVVAIGGGFRDEVPPDLGRPVPPVAIAHGRADDRTPIAAIRRARDVLERAGGTVAYLETDAGHELDPAFVPHVRAFLAGLP